MIKVTRKTTNIEMVVYVLEPGEKLYPAFTPDIDRRPPHSVVNFIWEVSSEKLFEYYGTLTPRWQVANPLVWSLGFQKVLQEILDEGAAIIKMRDVCD